MTADPEMCSECGAYWPCEHRGTQRSFEQRFQDAYADWQWQRMLRSGPIDPELLTPEGWQAAHDNPGYAWDLDEFGQWVRKQP